MVVEQLGLAKTYLEIQDLRRQLVISPNAASLRKAIVECRKNPFSPEGLTKFWQAELEKGAKRIGLSISVPDCPWPEEEIRRPMVDIKGREVPSMLVYVPLELTGKKGLLRLGRMYRKLKDCWAVQKGTTLQDDPDGDAKSGWIKVEASVDAPNRNTTQKQLENFAEKKRYLPQRLNTYILACRLKTALTGRFLDQGKTGSRLVGFHHEGFVVCAYFELDGHLRVHWSLLPQDHSPSIGGRFEEVKKA